MKLREFLVLYFYAIICIFEYIFVCFNDKGTQSQQDKIIYPRSKASTTAPGKYPDLIYFCMF